MHHFSIPTCYFPSTALFIDDSRDFLLNFVLQLDEGVAYRIFDTPYRALDYIHNKSSELDLFSNKYSKEYRESKIASHANQQAKLDLAAIHSEVYNPNRFGEISVVVVDYAMPGMNGIEFCRRIENNNIKKILLSGQADEKLAIAAFNEGLIHRYIKKSDVNAAELITKSIYDLQAQYFQAMSDLIVRMLAVNLPSCLEDKKFASLFRQICQENKIIEYYLAEPSGSYLLLDDDANVSYLIIKTEQEKNEYLNLAQHAGASKEVLNALASGEKIPFLIEGDRENVDWEKCLVPAQRIDCNEPYYYAYLPGQTQVNVRQQKILSYHRYLEELDAEELLMG